ncbi:TPR repeat-containing thioredoxin TDX isoform X2 [Phalaenopsis equestris]|uniref:TPR repeat-containing thioredoxin TDX isoform X2 n=1 Tax=Phalaenopsis equestris TaxID=78828 RepID=UPI0009E409B6|nr:TPR repeat-containing thioredoxin TDX isoform X2 [Phalaenopsis equestris]
MDATKVAQLRAFVSHCKSDPSFLHDPSLGFFRDYLDSIGARIPFKSASKSDAKQEMGTMPNAEFVDSNNPKPRNEVDDDDNHDDEIVESDIELEGEVVEPDNDSPQKMGDPSVEVTEENRDAAQISKAKAVDAISEGKHEDAIEHLTEAIMLNPTSAILYATRASVFVKMRKPNAAIRDADAALQINSDSAKGYKSRGMAKALMGNWQEAVSDLRMASKLDHDEEIYSVLKMKVEEHRKKYEHLKNERERRKAKRRHQRDEAANRKAESEYLSVLQDGNVLTIRLLTELETKLKAASKLSRLSILYFTATWCGPCRSIAPVYKSLAEQHHKVVFLKLDIDEVRDVAHRWNVSSVPTFFFVKDGKEIDKIVGADKMGLERKIALHSTKL